jgi:hypothetical protein
MVESVAVIISAVIALFVSAALVFAATMIVHRLTDRWHRAGRSAALQITELLRLR